MPLFRYEQIRAIGGPVDGDASGDHTRYFMTIPEACQLILQAGVLGHGGEIFALDMGEPVKISYLAEQMVRLANKTPGRDIAIVYTGLRPGEKLFEELFHAQESYQSIEAPPREDFPGAAAQHVVGPAQRTIASGGTGRPRFRRGYAAFLPEQSAAGIRLARRRRARRHRPHHPQRLKDS